MGHTLNGVRAAGAHVVFQLLEKPAVNQILAHTISNCPNSQCGYPATARVPGGELRMLVVPVLCKSNLGAPVAQTKDLYPK